MNKNTSDKTLQKKIRFYVRLSFASLILLIGGIGGWAVMTEISGAVVGSGIVVVESHTKQVQHQEGGIVKKIHVQNGDMVKAGDLLIELDDTITLANLAIITKQLNGLYAQETRLETEQNGHKKITFAPFDQHIDEQRQDKIATLDHLKTLQESQRRLFTARHASLMGQKQQLREQILQFEKQIEGYQAQEQAKKDEIRLVENELKDLSGLLSQKLISASRVSGLSRTHAKLKGELGGLTAQIAQTKEAISERNIQVLQLDTDFLTSVLTELQSIRAEIAQLEEQRIAALDQLKRIEIRAPRSGYVHNLNVHTIGHVLAAGDITMLIVPKEDQLMIEAHISPSNIDQIAANQTARIRFPSFDQRTTPELKAHIKTISADLLQDQISGLSYYLVRLAIPKQEMVKLKGQNLIPGMPAETFIKTQNRTVISYLTKPITDQIKHALRER